MAAKISISNHAVERYRERMTKDALRKDRTAESIRKIIKDSIIACENWPQLEEQMKDGTKKEYQLRVRLFDGWDLLGVHRAVLTPSRKGRSYTVVTFV